MESGALVFGASGFIGRHLVRRLLQERREVILLAREFSEIDEFSDQTRIFRADDWTREALLKTLEKQNFATVFNLASYGVNPADRHPLSMHLINVELPVSLAFVAAAHNATLVLTGTCSEYSPAADTGPLSEDHPLERTQLYGSTKAAGGIAACAVATALKVPAMLLRLFNVYGHGEGAHRLLPTLVRGLTTDRRVPLSEGNQIRDFVYVSDVIDALLAAQATLQKKPSLITRLDYNVSTGVGHTVREFCSIACKALGASSQFLGYGDFPMRSGEIPMLVGRADAFKAATGWSAKTRLEAGVERAIAMSRLTRGNDNDRS
jgi:nucleoside-diphosphate-sugar epimerase